MAETKDCLETYEIVKQIGTGSFGIVYLVKWGDTNDQTENERKLEFLVMKQISLTKLDTKQRTDAQKEITLLSTLLHPNIVSYRHSFQTESQHLHIVMDYCDGGDLYRKIMERKRSKEGPFAEQLLMHWFVQVCLALKYIHERKILHRDLKTQNIFTCNSDTIVKLGDFGIAKILDHTADLAATCIGTPYYLSPEVCQNRPYGTKTDVWAFGCVFYELATFRHPFEGRHLTELLSKIVRGMYEPLPSVYSSRLKHLISQLLKVNSHDRPDINGLFLKEYVYEHTVDFLRKNQRLSELSIVEELMKQKRSQIECGVYHRMRKLGVTANSLHRQSTDSTLFRKKTPMGPKQRAHFERKYRMYMPSAIRLPTPTKMGGPQGRRRPFTAGESHHVPMDPVPPPRLDEKEQKLDFTEKTVQTAGFGTTVTLPRPSISSNSTRPPSANTKCKKRERKKWAAPRAPFCNVLTSPESTDSWNNVRSPPSSGSSAPSCSGVKGGRVQSQSVAPLLPSLPGSVDDGWPADEWRICDSCGGRYTTGNMKKIQVMAKLCQSCQLKNKPGAQVETSDAASIFEKIECLRQDLETKLGLVKFANLYCEFSTGNTGQIKQNSRRCLDQATKKKLETLLFLEKAYHE